MTYGIAPHVLPVASTDRQPAELAAGAVVDQRYRLDTPIGEGGMGVVWLATDLALDRAVAIKVIRENLAGDAQVISRVLLEARAIAQFRGENVVRVLDVGRLPAGAPYIVMEHLEGNDLFEELAARGPLPSAEAVDYVLQACEGLAEAHAEGIVHRDLKPENLFLAVQPNGSLVVKLIDFGVSKRIQSGSNNARLTKRSTFVGSPQYTAPEQMRAVADVDQRADIWSLGAILYEILSGVSPFEAATTEAVCVMVMTATPPPLDVFCKDVPEELERVIRKCLEKERGHRYTTVAELAADLVAFGSPAAGERAERISRVLHKIRSSRPTPTSSPVSGSRPPLRPTSDSSLPTEPVVAPSRVRKPALALGAVLALSGGALALDQAAPGRLDAALGQSPALIRQAGNWASALLHAAPPPTTAAERAEGSSATPYHHAPRMDHHPIPVVLTAFAEPERDSVLGAPERLVRNSWQRRVPEPLRVAVSVAEPAGD